MSGKRVKASVRREPLPRAVTGAPQPRCGHESCGAFVARGHTFCSEHGRAGVSPAELAEEYALGESTAAQLRADLTPGEEEREGMAEKKASENPVAAATRLAVEMAGQGGAKVGVSVQAPKRAPSPEAAAMQIALAAVAQEKAEADRRAQRRQPGGRPEQGSTGRAALALTAYYPELPDLAAMRDSKGNSLVKPGWIPRWVRKKDLEGKPDDGRWRLFQAWGAEEVLDENGEPLEGRLGKAVQLPPERYAARVLRHSPTGAFDSDRETERLIEAMEDVNRQAGYRVGSIVPREGHGSRQFE